MACKKTSQSLLENKVHKPNQGARTWMQHEERERNNGRNEMNIKDYLQSKKGLAELTWLHYKCCKLFGFTLFF